MGDARTELRSVKVILFLLLLFALHHTDASANPSFTIGSDPYLTVFAYPHDLLHWPDRGVVFSFSPQTLPWQGDVTDISNRPSEAYTNNYQNVEFATPSGYDGNPDDIRSWMEVSSYVYKKRFTTGGLYTTGYGRFLVEMGHTALNMELSAQGVGRAYEGSGDAAVYYLVPFRGETNARRSNLDLTVTYAHRYVGYPVGLKVRYTRSSSEVPDGYIGFTKNGETHLTPHLTWGWATTGCNHIFGYSHINTDAFFQNDFTIFSGNQWDIQASSEHHGNYKTGIRYRRNRQDGENYTWKYLDGSEYMGNYHVDQYWKDRKSNDLIRGYSKVRFWEIGNMDLGTLFFLQYASHSTTEVSKMVESDPSKNESEKEFIIETNPWLNWNSDRGYLDFGLLMELSRTWMRNTQTRWNSASKSDQKDVLWSTSPSTGWSTSWERFSRGSAWFFATGFEAYSSINVYKRLAIQSRLMVLRKFTYTTKIYGDSEIPDGGNSYEFMKTHERNDSKNETWMTGSIGLSYGWGPIQAFLSLDLPLAYLIKQKTKLSDTGEELFEHSKRNMWQVQEPVTTRFRIVCAL